MLGIGIKVCVKAYHHTSSYSAQSPSVRSTSLNTVPDVAVANKGEQEEKERERFIR
jgi:hypothetical protein